ncbi:MAG: helix-turn-helix transcriptional regulator [Clostridiales bacterium]|nr:helix-turn-helix transcriptional regulator [Clostridiales bacterium]
MISYKPLWRTLQDKGVSQYRLIKDYGVSAGQLSRLRSNENVSTHTLNMLCEILDCRLEDIAEYKKDEEGSKT